MYDFLEELIWNFRAIGQKKHSNFFSPKIIKNSAVSYFRPVVSRFFQKPVFFGMPCLKKPQIWTPLKTTGFSACGHWIFPSCREKITANDRLSVEKSAKNCQKHGKPPIFVIWRLLTVLTTSHDKYIVITAITRAFKYFLQKWNWLSCWCLLASKVCFNFFCLTSVFEVEIRPTWHALTSM